MATHRGVRGRSRHGRELDSRHSPLGQTRAGRRSLRRLTAGGTTGNEQLTAAAGVLLIALLVPLGVTILRIGPLLGAHMFIGLLLIPPVLLKMASTGYRFVRYYTRSPSYRRKGPPALVMRELAPGVVLSTSVVFASGVALLLLGPSSRGWLLTVHKASFFAWIGFTAIHVIGHLPALARAIRARGETGAPASPGVSGRDGRLMSLIGVVVAGLVLAILYIPQFTPWLHAHHVPGAH
jgi:hypothetical protein